jgi:two-component system cell cycle sensor histidine kinase PleC
MRLQTGAALNRPDRLGLGRTATSPLLGSTSRHTAAGFDRAKQSFLAAMSHELRTPLNAIIGFAEIMDAQVLGPVETPQYRQYIRDILESGRHLLRIIEGVLDITSAEAGELVLSKHEVELTQLVEQAARETEALREARGIRLESALAEDIIVRVDPEKVQKALACLISNAVKFSGEGTSVQIKADIDDANVVRVEITDRGIGIEPVALDRVFLPFVQLEDKLCRRFDGAGLGLPIARLFAELHGGAVELDSRRGVGTTAVLILPAYAAAGRD